MKHVMFVIGLLLAWPATVRAQLPFDESPWRTEATVGEVRYRFWVDTQAINPDAAGGRSPWRDLQRYARMHCFGCAQHAWGGGEYDRAKLATDTKDRGYVPLTAWTFVPLNIMPVGGALPEPQPVYRGSARDSLIIVLRDGRELASAPPIDVPTPRFGIKYDPDGVVECMRLERQLEGIKIFTTEELRLLWKSSKDRYGDRPWANIALVPVGNQGRDFGPNDVAQVVIVWQGQRIVLSRSQMTAATR